MKQRNTHWANGFESFVNFLCPTRRQSCRFQIYYPIMVFMSWNTSVRAHAATSATSTISLVLKKWENNKSSENKFAPRFASLWIAITSIPSRPPQWEMQGLVEGSPDLEDCWYCCVMVICYVHVFVCYVWIWMFICSMFVCMCNHARYSIMLSL